LIIPSSTVNLTGKYKRFQKFNFYATSMTVRLHFLPNNTEMNVSAGEKCSKLFLYHRSDQTKVRPKDDKVIQPN